MLSFWCHDCVLSEFVSYWAVTVQQHELVAPGISFCR